MNILLVTVGSSGDVHPFIGIGRALQGRGHRVLLATNDHFKGTVEAAGLEFRKTGSAADYDRMTLDPDLFHATRGLKLLTREVPHLMKPVYELIASLPREEHWVVVASSLALSARVAQEVLGIPLVMIHLSPSIIRSIDDPSLLPGMPDIRRWPRWARRLVFWSGDTLVVDRTLGKAINQFRAGFGLAPVRGIFKEWWHSPLRVIGTFPEWFGRPAADWPAQVRCTDFPLYDEAEIAPLDSAVERFLAAGDAPIVFTAGSAMRLAGDFYAQAVEACRLIGRRGVFLSKYTEQIPSPLPGSIMHAGYAPFSVLLPRCAALVHHGGIGTTAQALRAGVPQLVVPLSHDQFDNADRVKRLGCGEVIKRRQLTAERMAAALTLITSAAYTGAAASIARRFDGRDSLRETCDLIEAAGHAGAIPAGELQGSRRARPVETSSSRAAP